jgi:histidinol dehydrogenase
MAELRMNRLSTAAPDFSAQLGRLLAWSEQDDASLHEQVREIIARVCEEGDRALLDFTRRFDKYHAASVKDLELPAQDLDDALAGLQPGQAEALRVAAERIRAYAEHQKMESWRAWSAGHAA